MKDFMTLAAERYSVRKFSNRPVEDEKLELILKAGHLAPTGCNNQPQRIYVIKSPEAVAKLKVCSKCHFDAPMALLVCYKAEECWTRRYDGETCGWTDACIVLTHMMLEAWELGIGSTWVMHFDPAAVKREYALEDGVVPVALLPMGYAAEDAEPAPLHAAFRPMEETVSFL